LWLLEEVQVVLMVVAVVVQEVLELVQAILL
jgi:hypothetical protein